MLDRPSYLLRLEAVVVLVAAAWTYSHLQLRWTLFAALFLVPDLSMLGFVVNTRLGAIFYNLVHTYVLPAGLLGFAFVRGTSWQTAVALIWIAHIAADRLLGYGLKYPTHFKDTHMQRVA